MLLKISNLSGESPVVPVQKLPEGMAAQATNCHFDSGSLIPYKNIVASVGLPADIVSVKYWRTANSELCLQKPYYADYVPGTVGGKDILYVSGGQEATIQEDTGKISPWGVSSPAKSVSVCREVDMSASPSPLAGTWGTTTYSLDYVYTCVDEYGRESAPSPTTIGKYELEVHQSKYCMLVYASSFGEVTFAEEFLGFKLSFPEAPECMKKRIYRAEVGESSAEFLFVAEIDGNMSEWTDFERVTFDDNGTSSQRGQLKTAQADALQTDGYLPPPSDLRGIRLLSCGSIAGFRKDSKELCFSHPVYQYSFPLEFGLKMPQTIRQIEVFGDDLIVFMDSQVCIVRGEPGFMIISSVPGVSGSQCGSGRSAVVFESGILFPGHDGLYLYSGGMCENLTKNITSPEQWQSWIGSATPPFYFHAVFYDNKYMAFRTGDIQGRITVFDLKTATMHSVLFGREIKSIYTPKHGHLGVVSADYRGNIWIVGESSIQKLDFSNDNMTAIWVSGIKRFPASCSIAAGLVLSDYSEASVVLKMKLTAGKGNGVRSVIFNDLIIPNVPFRLPGGETIDNLQIELSTNIPIHEIRIATSMQELVS